jgi:glycogen debranching enzyme
LDLEDLRYTVSMSLNLPQLQLLAKHTLNALMTDEGIYASSARGIKGRYHGYFGRDSTITAAFIQETEKANNNAIFLPMAVNSLLRLSEWQGKKEDPATREELGKIPHEIREKPADYKHLTEGLVLEGLLPFYVDPTDHIMKNWDSNDATPLWIIVVSRLIQAKVILENDSIYLRLEKALLWCLRNLDEFGGFAGYTLHARGSFYELPNQAWKDTRASYLHHDGRQPTLPIRDVAVNAWVWTALMYGHELFRHRNSLLSDSLKEEAARLKERFNSEKDGFLMPDPQTGYYFAEALDGKGHKLHGVCSDPALALWGFYEDTCILEKEYIPNVIKRLFLPDMFDPEAGIRTYSSTVQARDPLGYHRGPHTFWPFVSGMIGIGLTHFQYHTEAKTVLQAMLHGVNYFDSCIELFTKKPGEHPKVFRDPETTYESSLDQAWTAGAVYYASHILKH